MNRVTEADLDARQAERAARDSRPNRLLPWLYFAALFGTPLCLHFWRAAL